MKERYCIDCAYFRVGIDSTRSLVTGRHESVRLCEGYKVNLPPGVANHTCDSVRQWSDACSYAGILWEPINFNKEQQCQT